MPRRPDHRDNDDDERRYGAPPQAKGQRDTPNTVRAPPFAGSERENGPEQHLISARVLTVCAV